MRARAPVSAARLWRRSTVDLRQNGTVRANGAQFHAAHCARNNEVPMARKWGSSRGRTEIGDISSGARQ